MWWSLASRVERRWGDVLAGEAILACARVNQPGEYRRRVSSGAGAGPGLVAGAVAGAASTLTHDALARRDRDLGEEIGPQQRPAAFPVCRLMAWAVTPTQLLTLQLDRLGRPTQCIAVTSRASIASAARRTRRFSMPRLDLVFTDGTALVVEEARRGCGTKAIQALSS